VGLDLDTLVFHSVESDRNRFLLRTPSLLGHADSALTAQRTSNAAFFQHFWGNPMFRLQRTKLFVTATVAVVLSVASTAVLASAMSYEGDDENADVKALACAVIGCANGGRACGTVGGTIKSVAPPFIGEVSVNFNCYEPLHEF